MTSKEVLLYLHQLPQNIIGWCLTRKPKRQCKTITNDGEEVKVYFTSNVFGAGVSLGNYIVLDFASYYILSTYPLTNAGKEVYLTTVSHEHGHQKQSMYLGWLYLLVIGLPSALGNITDRVFHKRWHVNKRVKWYYNQPWEHWADKLGYVNREY